MYHVENYISQLSTIDYNHNFERQTGPFRRHFRDKQWHIQLTDQIFF